jgi:hypothetical protein
VDSLEPTAETPLMIFDGRGAALAAEEVFEHFAIASKWDSRDVARQHQSAAVYFQTRFKRIVHAHR